MPDRTAPPDYQIAPDRAGFALATGGLLGGVATSVLAALGGAASIGALVAALIVGVVIAMMAIVAIGGPLWMLCHALGRRGPGTALTIGALIGLALFLDTRGYGAGLFDLFGDEDRGPVLRLAAGLASALLLALIGGGIALAMWRVAYRRG